MKSLVRTVFLVASLTFLLGEGIPAPYVFPSESVLPIFNVSRFVSSESDESSLPQPSEAQQFTAFHVRFNGALRVKREVPFSAYSAPVWVANDTDSNGTEPIGTEQYPKQELTTLTPSS